jgi:trehalose synthase
MQNLDSYVPIVGQAVIDDLRLVAKKLIGKKITIINSTAIGGGVAEILSRMIPIFKELDLDIKWDVIKGGSQFFDVTKKFHNALQGRKETITEQDFEIFIETNKKNQEELDLTNDIIFIHDPQPIALIEAKTKNKWIWRCHIDASNPNEQVWNFLKPYIERYDVAIFSAPSFAQRLSIRQFLISPSIDPLSDKNKDMPKEIIDEVLKKYKISNDKPIIAQISRFDWLKDPIGVIDAYKLVKKHIDCQLVLAGGTASDDPESYKVLEAVHSHAKNDQDIHILMLPHTDIEINALQRAATVIIQKSLREGFGLTVSEALWKAKPVVASQVGGIPLQIKHKYSGLLCHSIEGAAFELKQILNSYHYAQTLGEHGKEVVKNSFLITRHVRDYLLLFLYLYYNEDISYI